MKIKYILFACILIAQSCNKQNNTKNLETTTNPSDSVSFWIKASKNKKLSTTKRKGFLSKSYKTIKSSKIDTIGLRHLSAIAYQNLKLKDTTLFLKLNNETLVLAEKQKDSFTIGDVHWSYATYYTNLHVYDSAYNHFNIAQKHFEKSGYIREAAKTQNGMASIRGLLYDYSGSEVLLFKVISKYKKLESNEDLYASYNSLGILQNDIFEYDKALYYYNISLEYLDKIKNKRKFKESSYNNIGNTYLKKKEYNISLSYYSKVLENDSLKKYNLNCYARLLANKAYCKLLMKDTINLKKHLHEALHIRDSLKNKQGVLINKIYISKYFAFAKDTLAAIRLAKQASTLAKELKNGRDYLASLTLLADLDTLRSKDYLKEHIRFSDSLKIIQRKTQNKFTRIDFQTDQYIQENKLLSQQKVWIIFTGSGLVLILALAYFIKCQKAKNQKLVFENEQEKMNKQVYVIAQEAQEKLALEKINERNRIAQELHDGILGKLFGTRMNLGFLDIEASNETKEQYQLFLDELQTIENEIREVSHKLSENSNSSLINFSAIIEELIENKCKIGGFTYKLEIDKHLIWEDINKVIKANVYRIIQESLHNITKHASAKNIILSFALNNGYLFIEIIDDGNGFNTKQAKKGIGIKNIKSRIKKLNGTFTIDSKEGKGTTTNIQIPV